MREFYENVIPVIADGTYVPVKRDKKGNKKRNTNKKKEKRKTQIKFIKRVVYAVMCWILL